MRDNGTPGAKALADPLALFPRFVAHHPPVWNTVIQGANVFLTLTTLVVLLVWVIPAVRDVQRMATDDRVEAVRREQAIEQSRDRVVRQQAATIAQQERTLQLMEENARLAETIGKTLKGAR